MKKTDISIIMPCYNAGPYVKTAIESVLRQDVPVQLIAVDDGSTDNTIDVLSAYSSDILVLQANHEGVANARNKAIEHLNSPYTLLLDADDAISPGSLAYLLGNISRAGNEVVYGHFSSWDRNLQKRLHLHRPARLGKSPLALLARQNISPPGAFLFPTGAFSRTGRFDQTVASCEDWDFLVRMARAGYQFTGLNREVFYYRRLPSSASNQVGRMLTSGLEVVRRCHSADIRVSDDRHPDGYASQDMVMNLFYYSAACMGLAALAPVPDSLSEIVRTLQVPPGVDWLEFRRILCQSIWWNSLALEGEQPVLIREALARCIDGIHRDAAGQPWCRDMVISLVTPDFWQFLRRPGPKKAIRLYREWKMARQIADRYIQDADN